MVEAPQVQPSGHKFQS